MQPDGMPLWLSFVLEWLHQEQALVAGLIAFCGAFWTVYYLRKQIGVQERQWRDQFDRRHRVARSKLPLALSELSDFCGNAYLLCKQAYVQFDMPRDSRQELNLSKLSPETFPILFEVVENSTHNEISRICSDIISEFQVVRDRLRDSINTFTSPTRIHNINNKEAYALRASEIEELRAHVERLYDYARLKSDRPNDMRSKDEAVHAFQFGKPNGDFERKVVEYINAYWPE